MGFNSGFKGLKQISHGISRLKTYRRRYLDSREDGENCMVRKAVIYIIAEYRQDDDDIELYLMEGTCEQPREKS